jgi:hypothetical protein
VLLRAAHDLIEKQSMKINGRERVRASAAGLLLALRDILQRRAISVANGA